MHQKITGQIDSTYTAQSHSTETLRDWHMQNSHVSRLVLSSQCVFPVFATIFLILFLVYLIELEPVNLGKKLNSQADNESPDEIKTAAISKVWIIVTISILFTVGAIATDISAVVEYQHLPPEIGNYTNDHSKAFIYLSVVPKLMCCFDLVSLSFIFVPFIVAYCKSCKFTRERCKDSWCDKRCKCKCEFEVSDFLYTLLSPLSCIATHFYHVIFAFINNPFHATSVLLSYIMTLFVVVVILQKTYYFVHNYFERKRKYYNVERGETATSGEGAANYQRIRELHTCTMSCNIVPRKVVTIIKGENCALAISFTVVIIALTTCMGLTVAVLIVIPIHDALDLAPIEIYAIYQASVTLFAALIAFQVFFRRKNAIFTVFIKAADKRGLKNNNNQEKWKKWEKMSEKEKEIHLGDILLSHIDFEPPESSTQNSSRTTSPSPSHASERELPQL
jgi:hypothetical protein